MFEKIEDLKEYITERGYEDTIVFENPSYVTAVAGLTDDGRVVYDFDEMVNFLVETDGMEPEEAIEFIEYNTIRAIPYFGPNAPIVMYPIMD